VFLLFAWGCSNTSPPPASKSQPSSDGQAKQAESQNKESETVNSSPNAQVTANLAKLSAEDRALAEKQKVCPVSGEELGSMGPPIKLDVKGQPVFICCDGCRDKLLANPEEYLAKLQK